VRRSDVPVQVGDVLDVEVAALGDGPDALAKTEGYVVLFPGALPGEQVRIEITSAARKFGRARLLEVLDPSPDRTKARCRHFLDCGGCHYQHIAYQAQLRTKADKLQKALDYALGDRAPEVADMLAPADPWERRHKIVLHLTDLRGRLEGCFHRTRSLDLVSITECPTSDPDGLDLAFAAVEELRQLGARAWLGDRPGGVLRTVLVRQSAGTGQSHVVLVTTSKGVAGLQQVAKAIHDRGATTVAWNQNDGPAAQLLGPRTQVLVGPHRIEELLAGTTFCIAPDAFFQTSPAGALLLQQEVLRVLQPGRGDVIADLYCGGGLFALPLAALVHHVVGVEQGLAAVHDARQGALRNGRSNVQFVHGSVHRHLPVFGKELAAPTKVVLDPPRDGCGADIARGIARLRPQRIAYVSCDGQALGRDLAAFAQHGYRCERVVPIDMFPHTCHIEAIAGLQPA